MLLWRALSLGISTSSSMLSLSLVIAAYIDPNTGGMLFQILAVLFGVISGALLLFSGKIKGIYYQIRRRIRDSSLEPKVEIELDNQLEDKTN
jgi:hypothetical protein